MTSLPAHGQELCGHPMDWTPHQRENWWAVAMLDLKSHFNQPWKAYRANQILLGRNGDKNSFNNGVHLF